MHTDTGLNIHNQHYTSDLHRAAVQQYVAQQGMGDEDAPLLISLIAQVVRAWNRRTATAKSA